MNNRIKWKKLKSIAENICGREVNISGSTLVNTVKAAVIDDGTTVEILINFNILKSLEDIIQGISHELAHVLLKTKDENKITPKWETVYENIKKRYEEE